MTLEIWTEKYRPKKLDEVVNQKEIVERLKAFVKSKNVPNMLFAGPAGIGKTTCALAIAHELYGEGWRQNYLETNASDERGIDTIRHKIKDFARTKPIGNVPFKIAVLDEADALTPEAQQALRRTMENYTQTCRFILIANYSSRIIDPIQSRCTVFRFSSLKEDDIKNHLKHISHKEKLDIDEKAIEAIIYLSEGDMRRSINLLQATAALGKKITEKTVYDVAAQAKPTDIKDMLGLALKGKFLEARKKLYELLINKGISGEDIIKELHRQIYDLDISEEEKISIIEKLGEYEFRMNQGGSPMIQLEALLAQISAFKKK
ncbi:MAG: replication factor C small subunit [Candidatus Aenigmarchaeota archaeon]|nr:replication factor C small subunit [Candidatus Aenigmarchaeota archaeon]